MEFNSLNPYHIDVLKEVANISIGNSVSKLSETLNTEVVMTVPNVQIVPYKNISQYIGDPNEKMHTIFSRFYGEINGNTIFLFRKNVTELLEDEKNAPENSSAIFAKIGETVTTSFVETLSSFSKLHLNRDISHTTCDLLGAIIQNGFLEYAESYDEVIFVNNSFRFDDNLLEGHLIFFPDPKSLHILFRKLGVTHDGN